MMFKLDDVAIFIKNLDDIAIFINNVDPIVMLIFLHIMTEMLRKCHYALALCVCSVFAVCVLCVFAVCVLCILTLFYGLCVF